MRGQCLCGEVAFAITGAIPKLYQCHCSLCRKQGGSSSNTALIVAGGNLRWLAGRERVASYVKDTGFRADFCTQCGSPVPNPLRNLPYYWVPAGLLDTDAASRAGLEIAAHLYVGSKAAWDVIPARGARYEAMPELQEFIELLRSHGDT